MAKASGKVVKVPSAISTKVIMRMIRNKDMEYFHGQVVTDTKENTKMTKEMATER